MAYSRGGRFLMKNSVALIGIPVAFITAYAWAFIHFHSEIGSPETIDVINQTFAKCGIDFKLGTSLNLGTEIMALSIWVMYLTVGWHYSKQIFGCVIVYSKYTNYPLTRFQRSVIKSSVFSVAFFNLVYMSNVLAQTGEFHPVFFMSVPIASLGLSDIYFKVAEAWLGISILSVLWFIVYRNYSLNKKWPSPNVAVPWIAFHIWWIPVLGQQEYYFLIVPFFHSLQYLPFAFKMENSKLQKLSQWRRNLLLLSLVLFGIAAFELIPETLDHVFHTDTNELPLFFTAAFVVFINVHHFFIDSVIWRSDQSEIKHGLFAQAAPQVLVRSIEKKLDRYGTLLFTKSMKVSLHHSTPDASAGDTPLPELPQAK
jgi:hypothetical protein